jgi:hypothetical protein
LEDSATPEPVDAPEDAVDRAEQELVDLAQAATASDEATLESIERLLAETEDAPAAPQSSGDHQDQWADTQVSELINQVEALDDACDSPGGDLEAEAACEPAPARDMDDLLALAMESPPTEETQPAGATLTATMPGAETSESALPGEPPPDETPDENDAPEQESVTDLLDGLFSDQAAAVGDTRSNDAARSIDTTTHAADESPVPIVAPPAANALPIDPVALDEQLEQEIADLVQLQVDDPALETEPESMAVPASPPAESAEPAAVPVVETTATVAPEVSPSPAMTGTARVESAKDAPPAPVAEARATVTTGTPRRAIQPTVISVLYHLNWPLRQLPESVRPLVDWLALSLVFWVPIIWGYVIFVAG